MLTTEQWLLAEKELREIDETLSNQFLLLITNGELKAANRISAVQDVLNGLAYLFHPQEEWTGGDSSDPKNFRVNPPHIAEK